MKKIPNTKKGYIIKRDNKCDDLMEAKDYYEDINNYFKENNNFRTGDFTRNKYKINELKKTELSKRDELPQCTYRSSFNSKINTITREEVNDNTTNKTYRKSKKLSLSIPKKIKINKKIIKNVINSYESNPGIHYQKKTLNEIRDIFKDTNLRLQKSLLNQKIYERNNLDNNMRNCLYNQNKILSKFEIDNSLRNSLTNSISNRIKKDTQDLLINKIGNYRYKKQIFDYMESKKSNRYIFGDNYWEANLRRHPKQNFLRINYFQKGNIFNMPIPVIDFGEKNVEFINDPKHPSKNILKNSFAKFLYNNYYKSCNKRNKKRIEQKNEIDILKGENLFNLEYYQIETTGKSSDGEKKMYKLYKDPDEQYSSDIVFRQHSDIKNLLINEQLHKSLMKQNIKTTFQKNK